MNILSLFDGISCGQVALERAGIKVNNYYASEIDKYAIQVTQKNYPDTIQLGDVTRVKGKDLPKIDLLIGGSPCQGFSFAGKQLNLEDERSKLFFEFVRLLKETKPKYFLLENVKMKKEYQDTICGEAGGGAAKMDQYLFGCITPDRINIRQDGKKSYTLTAQGKRGVLVEGHIRKLTPIECERLQTLPDNYTEGISNSQRYKCLGNSWTVDVIAHILKNIK